MAVPLLNLTREYIQIKEKIDKAVFNVPSPASGILKEIVAQDGTEVKVGETLAILE